jgi:integrase
MASVRRKQDSKYWFACFSLPTGERTQRSTKEIDRRRAQKLADAFEEAARKQMTARQMQSVIAGLYEKIVGTAMHFATVRDYFTSWLSRKKPETAGTTFAFYEAKARRFLAWLGTRADEEIARVTQADVLAYRKAELERVSAPTVNHEIKFLRMVFKTAKDDGFIAENPADAVKSSRRTEPRIRRAFTLPELERVLAVADEEWQSLVLFGLYTGQRLGDLARLTWQNVDLQREEIRLVTSKTGRQQIIPLAPPLRKHVESISAGDDPKQPLHPRAFASVTKSGKVGTLSRQFYELLASAGLAAPKRHRAAESAPGRDGRRNVSEISFHALRHTATSLMKNAGISPAIVQDIIGHESAAISANYTHIEESAKRYALGSLPDISRPAKAGAARTKARRGERGKV